MYCTLLLCYSLVISQCANKSILHLLAAATICIVQGGVLIWYSYDFVLPFTCLLSMNVIWILYCSTVIKKIWLVFYRFSEEYDAETTLSATEDDMLEVESCIHDSTKVEEDMLETTCINESTKGEDMDLSSSEEKETLQERNKS